MGRVTDKQIWSWVDRAAPELQDYLDRHPDEVARVREIQSALDGVAAASPLAPPTQVGPFRLGKRLGEGGMGVVFEAEQDRPQRTVAIKLLRCPGPPSPEAAIRLEREADALAQLHHPGIAVVYSAGESSAGVPYIAMEFIRGLALDDHAAQHDLDQTARLSLFTKVCEAVQHAHAAGMLHRDLKPQNILVTPEGQPKVLDFGLAQWIEADPGQTLTATGALVGTLPYMSPEQIGAAPDKLGPPSDVYALGVILYQLLLGQLPQDLEGAPLAVAARRITSEPPLRPRAVAPDLNSDLEAILLRALAKDPLDRYSTVEAFAQDLERLRHQQPVLAKRWSLQRHVLAAMARHRTALIAAGLAIATVGLLGFAAWRLYPALIARALPGEYAKVAPYEAVRFRGPCPEVLFDGEWFELLEIDGVSTQRLVAEFSDRRPGRWQKRFAEDLWQYFLESGRIPSKNVDLLLRDLQSGDILRRHDEPMTRENRQSSWRYRYELLENRLFLADDGKVRLGMDKGSIEVHTIGSVGALALADAVPGGDRDYCNALIELLTVKDNHRAGRTVRVTGLASDSGEFVELDLHSDSADLNRPILLPAERDALYDKVRQH